jgi:hypothetical protein
MRSLLLWLLSAGVLAAWPNGYTYRRAITIDFTKVPNTDQSNFPVLVSGTYSYLATTANAGNVRNASGFDVIFTSDSAGATKLNWEVETYTAATGVVIYWVQIPTVSHTANTVFYLFYGNASISTDQSNKTGTWDTNYKGVYHLPNGTTLSAADSTSNAANGTITGATATTGQIDGGSVSGTGKKIDLGQMSGLQAKTALTQSAWIFSTGHNTANTDIFISKVHAATATDPFEDFDFWVNSTNHLVFEISSGVAGSRVTTTSSGTITASTWTYVTAVYNGANTKIYKNGVQDATTGTFTGTLATNTTNNVFIGFLGLTGNADEFTGNLDEVRLSSVARSADWITTEYNSQSSPSTFYTVGVEQAQTVNSVALNPIEL